MWLDGKWPGVLIIIAGLLGLANPSSGQVKTVVEQRRPVTVADTIRMTRIAGSPFPGVRPKSGFTSFSPDGKQFVMVVSQGSIERNTNDYSLLLFRTADVFNGAIPGTLVSFSSSSNRLGIFDVKWSEDNDTIFFLGTRGGEATELYSIRCSSGELKKLTNHSTSLVSYAVSDRGSNVVYAAEKPELDLMNENVLRYGLEVGRESLADLVRGRLWEHEPELFLKGFGAVPDKRLKTQDPFDSGVNDLFLSPDGRYVVVKTNVTELPEKWSAYKDPSIQAAFRHRLPKGFGARVLHYELIGTQTDRSRVLLDSPTTYSLSDVGWSPDSKSLLLCGTYLPLDVDDRSEFESRRSTRFVVEINLVSRTIVKITNEDLRPIQWEPQTNIVQFQTRQIQHGAGGIPDVVCYRKTGQIWERLSNAQALVNDARPEILAEQGLNLPPRIVAVDAKTKRKALLLDLNPQFAGLAFGNVEEIDWTDSTGHPVSGGLYMPPNYVAGKKYPLVIQTHGFDPDGFWIEGAYTTADAAQPLASMGIVVLQMNDIFYDSLETSQEAQRVMSAYENAVEFLDQKGIIDRNRVGLVGFSRTCWYVKYALTHSHHHFAAAIVSDGVDGGYLQYLLFYTYSPYAASSFESIIGAPPFGDGLSLWVKNSPGFLLDKVQTPLQIQATEPSSLLNEWEWFSGLKRLNKPVDLVYLPTGTHILVKPWDRLVSQGRSVDWFCFWLKAEQDLDPEKAEQYVRWGELRKQLANQASRN